MQFKPIHNSYNKKRIVYLKGCSVEEIKQFYKNSDGFIYLKFCGYFLNGKKVGKHTFFKKETFFPKKIKEYDIRGNFLREIIY